MGHGVGCSREIGGCGEADGRAEDGCGGDASEGPLSPGMGMGQGMGRGMGMGRGAAVYPTPPAPPAAFAGSREEEIAALKDVAGDLRKQLAEVIERLDRLEKVG